MGYVYLCELSEYKVGQWAHINGWTYLILESLRLGVWLICVSTPSIKWAFDGVYKRLVNRTLWGMDICVNYMGDYTSTNGITPKTP